MWALYDVGKGPTMSNGAVQPMMLPLEGSGYSADLIHVNVTCMVHAWIHARN